MEPMDTTNTVQCALGAGLRMAIANAINGAMSGSVRGGSRFPGFWSSSSDVWCPQDPFVCT